MNKYSMFIEMPNATLSGICVFAPTGEGVQGSVFNEFGLTILNFTYIPDRDRVTLHQVTGVLDRWYIRRQLRKDLWQLIHNLRQGRGVYRNERRGMTYTLTPLADDDNSPKQDTYDTEK